jgi:hypothetical protein
MEPISAAAVMKRDGREIQRPEMASTPGECATRWDVDARALDEPAADKARSMGVDLHHDVRQAGTDTS